MSKKHTFNVTMQRTGKKVLLVLSGYIYPEGRNSSAEVAEKLNEVNDGDELHVMLRNLYGGSVMEGLTIYHDLKALKPLMMLDGVAASMGAIIFQAGETRRMSKHSKLMLHRVTAGAYGDPDQMEETVKQAREWEKECVDILAEATGLSEKEVRKTYMNSGKDVWLTSAEAKEAGLTDEVVTGSLRTSIPKKDVEEKDPEDILEMFEAAMSAPETAPEPKRQFASTMSLFKKKPATAAITALHNVKAEDLTPEQLAAADAELQAQNVNAFLVPVQDDAKSAEELSAKYEKMEGELATAKAGAAKAADLQKKLDAANATIAKLEGKKTSEAPDAKAKKDKAAPSSTKEKKDPMAVVNDPNVPWNKMVDGILGAPKAADPGDEEEEEEETADVDGGDDTNEENKD